MLSQQDLQQIAKKGITEAQIETQLGEFKTGFPFLKLKAAASIEDGIVATNEQDKEAYIEAWTQYKQEGHKIVKFVPASGAASRMFKDMFAFLDADYDVPTTAFEKQYFDNIRNFAFYDALDAACRKNEGKSIKYLIQEGQYKKVVANMLFEKGLNYGQLPKGMLLFHNLGAETQHRHHCRQSRQHPVPQRGRLAVVPAGRTRRPHREP